MRKLILLFLSVSLGFTNQIWSQLSASTYQLTALSGTYTPITGGTSVTAIQVDDAVSAALPIGFTFNYCGLDYTQIKASSNGWLTFDLTITASNLTNSQAGITGIDPGLMPLWDDLSGAAGTAQYLTTGTAPNRVFTMQFTDWRWNFSSSYTPTISFQVKLYESTNIIEYHYTQLAGTGNTSGSSGASIGIVDNLATPGFFALNDASTAPTTSTTTLAIGISTRPASGQIYRFRPLPPIDMGAIAVFADTPFCSNSTQPVYARIKNFGTATIDTVTVHWTANNVAQTPVIYTSAPIPGAGAAPNNEAVVNLGDYFFPNSTPVTIKAWTYQPNNLPDADNTNDSITGSVEASLQGVYVELPNDTIICSNGTITVDAGTFPKNPIYIWSNALLTQSIDITSGGTYWVKVQNTDGCFDYDTINITSYPDPVVNSIPIIDNGGGSFTFNVLGAANVDEYKWEFGNGVTIGWAPGVPGQQIQQFTTGEYNVTLSLRNKCSQIEVVRKITVGSLGLNELAGIQSAFKLYPNPAKDYAVLENDLGVVINSVVISNVLGQKVNMVSGINKDKFRIETSELPAGIYTLTIVTDKGMINKKLEILK